MTADGTKPDTEVSGAVLRAGDVLTLFAQSPESSLGISEISRTLHLSKAVVSRILASLCRVGFVELDPDTHRYLLGPQSLLLGLAYLSRVNVYELAREAMVHLSVESQETAAMALRIGWERVFVDQVTPQQEITMLVPLGQPLPLHVGSTSRAYLAFLPVEERQRYFESAVFNRDELARTSMAEIEKELEEIRANGYARSAGEQQPGAASVAAPVLGRNGLPEVVLTVCGPDQRFLESETRIVALLLDTIGRLSRRLGNY